MPAFLLILLLLLLLLLPSCGPARSYAAAERPVGGFLRVEGGTLYYESRGRGPAVVLLHGGFGDLRMWDAQVEDFSRRFHVVRYDHRGFGRSSVPDTAYSPVADLLRLLDHLGIERAHLVGNSLGGALALDVALLHPGRVRSLVMVSAGPNGFPIPEEEVERMSAVFRAAAEQGVEHAAELWLRNPMVTVAASDPGVAPKLRRMVAENSRVFRMRHWPQEQMTPVAFERLAEVRVPTLLMVGEDDTPLVRAAAQAAAAGIPGAALRIIRGADHLPQMEKPAEFNRIVREFLLPL